MAAKGTCLRLALLAAAALLPAGCLTMEPAEVTATQIRNPSAGSYGYRIDIPRGYTALPLPEYIPHVAFTQAWLASAEAAPFQQIAQSQALEQKLRADHLIYRRPNYRAYFSTSGEDFLLVPDGQLDEPAPSPFIVFSTLNRGRATDEMGLGDYSGNRIGRFGTRAAGSLGPYATDVSVDTRKILGREWIWLTATITTPIPPAGDLVDAVTAPEVAANATQAPPETWRFLYLATLGRDRELFAIQGWSHPEDFRALVEAIDGMAGSLSSLYGKTEK